MAISTLEPTRYEVIAKKAGDPHIWLIGYTPRKSRAGLVACMQNVGHEIVQKLGVGDDKVSYTKTSKGAAVQIGDWLFQFGNTQRECQGCEHKFIAA